MGILRAGIPFLPRPQHFLLFSRSPSPPPLFFTPATRRLNPFYQNFLLDKESLLSSWQYMTWNNPIFLGVHISFITKMRFTTILALLFWEFRPLWISAWSFFLSFLLLGLLILQNHCSSVVISLMFAVLITLSSGKDFFCKRFLLLFPCQMKQNETNRIFGLCFFFRWWRIHSHTIARCITLQTVGEGQGRWDTRVNLWSVGYEFYTS